MDEPNPVLVDALRKVELNVNYATVVAQPGEVSFNLALNDEASSVLPLLAASVYGATLYRKVSVPVITLESLVDSVERIDLLKIDIEGAEIDVLKTTPATVLSRVAQLTIEFHCHESFGFGKLAEVRQIINRLRQLGFIYLEFSPTLVNVLFLNRRSPLAWYLAVPRSPLGVS